MLTLDVGPLIDSVTDRPTNGFWESRYVAGKPIDATHSVTAYGDCGTTFEELFGFDDYSWYDDYNDNRATSVNLTKDDTKLEEDGDFLYISYSIINI